MCLFKKYHTRHTHTHTWMGTICVVSWRHRLMTWWRPGLPVVFILQMKLAARCGDVPRSLIFTFRTRFTDVGAIPTDGSLYWIPSFVFLTPSAGVDCNCSRNAMKQMHICVAPCNVRLSPKVCPRKGCDNQVKNVHIKPRSRDWYRLLFVDTCHVMGTVHLYKYCPLVSCPTDCH
jgi:hypothetical protein